MIYYKIVDVLSNNDPDGLKNLISDKKIIKNIYNNYINIMDFIIKNDYDDLMIVLINHNPKFFGNYFWENSLIFLCKYNSYKCLKFLLNSSITNIIDTINDNFNKLLLICFQKNSIKSLKILLKNTNNQINQNIIYNILMHKKYDYINLLMEKNHLEKSIHKQFYINNYLYNIFMLNCYQNCTEKCIFQDIYKCIDILFLHQDIIENIDINYQCLENGNTPLHFFCGIIDICNCSDKIYINKCLDLLLKNQDINIDIENNISLKPYDLTDNKNIKYKIKNFKGRFTKPCRYNFKSIS